jgi:hypothetical protein
MRVTANDAGHCRLAHPPVWVGGHTHRSSRLPTTHALAALRRTGILIGVHGAALTFVASTTAGESALLELAGLGWEDTQTGNMLNLFPSLAHNVGAYYEQVGGGGAVYRVFRARAQGMLGGRGGSSGCAQESCVVCVVACARGWQVRYQGPDINTSIASAALIR